MEASAPRLHPMGVIDQLDTAFRLYRRHFVTFVGIAALLRLPLLALSIVAGLAVAGSEAGASTGLYCLVLLIQLPIQAIITGALAYATSSAYLGQQVDIASAYGYAVRGRRAISLIFASWAIGFLSGLTLIPAAVGSVLLSTSLIGLLCFVPSLLGYLYILLRTMVTSQVIVLEDRGASDAISRTWNLMEGHLWRALGLGVFVALLTQLVPPGLQALANAVFAMAPVSPVVYLLATVGLAELIYVLLAPIPLGAYTLLYYDLRMRKEGYDLQWQAQHLATGSPQA